LRGIGRSDGAQILNLRANDHQCPSILHSNSRYERTTVRLDETIRVIRDFILRHQRVTKQIP
jgi:hypothetical protein